MTSLMNKYLNESEMGTPEHKLFLRFMDVRNKADKMYNQMFKMEKQIAIIQKKAKKLGLDNLTNHNGYDVLDVHEDPFDVVWSMFSDR